MLSLLWLLAFHSRFMKKYLTHIILTLSFLLPFTGYAACSLDETSSTAFLTDCSKDTIGIKPSDTTSSEA